MKKSVQKVLSLLIATALMAVSLFTDIAVSATSTGAVDLLEFGDYLLEAGSTSIYYDTVLADEGETGDSWENAIIIDNAEEFVYLARALGNDTAGKYYKVADGIKAFDLSDGQLDFDAGLAANINTIKSSGKNHAGGTPGFQGHFDGNGVTVYGAWTNHNEGCVSDYAGLFSCTAGNVTIKNVNVKFASFTAKTAAGGIVGYYKGEGDYTNNTTLTIENCSVTDSHFEVSGTGWGCGVGAIVGRVDSSASYIDEKDENGNGKTDDRVWVNNKINIKNCYVNLDETYFISKAEDGVEETDERACHGGVAGMMGTNALSVKDCVVIGIKPYATSESTAYNDVQHSGLESHFANVYTTSDVAIEGVNLGGNGALGYRNFTGKVFPLSDAQLKGAAAVDNMDLDWSVWMADDDSYPELRSMHKDVAFVDNGNGTHSEVCDCGFGGVAVPHTFAEDGACACGAKKPNCANRDTIYWDGTIATGIATGSGTKDDPYIIKTAAEFAWLLQNADEDGTKATTHKSADKYYEIAENIGAIVLQDKEFAEDIMALKNANEVAAFFENEEFVFTQWPTVGWEVSSFCGNFDGNGATVYGLYQVSTNNAGLFSTVDAGAVIKNIALKNSYLTSTAGNYQVGGLAAVTSGSGYGRNTNGAIWFDSCVVANNYMYNSSTSHDRTGVIIGASSDMTYVENCLVYGNNATYGDGVQAPIWSNGQTSQVVTGNEIIPEGLVTKNDGAETPRYYNVVRNSVILGAKPYDLAQMVGSRFNDPKCYEYVYTDADVANDVFSNGVTIKVSEDQLKKVSLGKLSTLDLGDKWYNTATYPELKVFHDDNLAVTPNNDGTHSSVCSCGTVFKSPCTFAEDGTCACGATFNCEIFNCGARKTITWDGTVASGIATGSGTKADPYVIKSASELAWLVQQKAAVTTDKYYKIDDDIGSIVLQRADKAEAIMALDNAEDVKAYFENGMFIPWKTTGLEAARFAGYFDGNGATIYGLYAVSTQNAALFCTVDGGAVFKNIGVKNSYIKSTGGVDYQAAALVATASGTGYSTERVGVVWFDSCVVANNYLYTANGSSNRSGVIIGSAWYDLVYVDNCLVYGNDATYGNGVNMAICSSAGNSICVNDHPIIPEGLVMECWDPEYSNPYYNNMVRNSIILGAKPYNDQEMAYRFNSASCYRNVLTDANVAPLDATPEQIKTIAIADINNETLSNVFLKTASIPELKSFHSNIMFIDNGDGTHSEVCACGAGGGVRVSHNLVNGECSVCDYVCDCFEAGACTDENGDIVYSVNDSTHSKICSVCGSEFDTTDHISGQPTPVDKYTHATNCTVCGYVMSVGNHEFGKNNPETPTVSATITFDADKENRIEFDANHQVWSQNGITVTNNKASSTSYVSDYGNPVRFYTGSEVIVEYPSMTKLVIDHTGQQSKYVGWKDSFSDTNATAVTDANTTTITFATPVDVFTFNSMSVQSRAYSITVYANAGTVELPFDPTGKTAAEIVDAAYALESGESFETNATLTGVITAVNTPYSDVYHNVTVTIAIEGKEDKPIECYRLKGEGADTITVEDKITVTGILKNYNGKIEFVAHCTLDAVEKGDLVVAVPEDPKEIVEETFEGTDPDAPIIPPVDTDGVCDICGYGCQHNFVDNGVLVEGDCVTDRVIAQICDICGIAGENRVEAGKGHSQDSAVMENIIVAKCTSAGSYDTVTYCKDCGEELSRQTVTIEARGHSNIKKYDTDSHWDYCTVCENIENVSKHVLAETPIANGTIVNCECGYSAFKANVVDQTGQAGVNASQGAFPMDTEIVFDLIEAQDDKYTDIKEILKSVSDKFVAYDITTSKPLNDGKEAEISFVIPEGYGTNVAIYYIDEKNNTFVKLPTEVRDGKAYAMTNHFSTYALVSQEAVFAVETDQTIAVAGNTITVNVVVKNNPGVISFKLDIGYDIDILELVEARGTDFTEVMFGPTANQPLEILWIDPLNPNNTSNGIVATLVFNVKETAAVGDTVITLDYSTDETFNEDFEDVSFATKNATIKVVDYLVGDVNSDGTVDMKDLGILKRYMVGWDVTIDTRAADVNADGKANAKDYAILSRYLADWDVELKYTY